VTRVVLDCDTGTDDAIAIMVAALHPEIDLLAVSTVNGNVPLPNTTENTLRVLDHIGARVPVYAGAERPLVRPDFPVPRHVLNADNAEFQLPYLDLPPSVSTPRAESAIAMLIDTFMAEGSEDITLVATGPLTNLALALIAEPRLAQRIGRLVMMGGSHVGGNVTPVAEFNFWVDPDATRSVFSAGIREVVVIPLDATHSAPLTETDCDELESLGTTASLAAASLIRHRIETDGEAAHDGETASAPVHDPLCMAYVVRPDVITSSGRYPVSIETAGEFTLGQMLVDTRPWAPDRPNASVAFRASHDVFRDVLMTALGNGSSSWRP
jgi:inosine-uridine nucleoside N-ribohydrolase